MMDFLLLGPLEVTQAGRTVPLPPGKPSALLARLLLDLDRVVSVDALVDGLWEGTPPPSAHKLVQVYVSRLRGILGHESIETRPPGYRVAAGPDRCDLARFETLTGRARNEGDPGRRKALLQQALALWRGPALAEFRSLPFATPAARRLAELRLNALEEQIEAQLELGEHDRLVAELEALVVEEPLRERPRRQLMLALYRSGRYAEALASYREARRSMIEDLGIEPGAALQSLERAILRSDPALDYQPSAGRDARGAIICTDRNLLPLLAPLCADGRDLVLIEVAAGADELKARIADLDTVRMQNEDAGLNLRTAAFTSANPAADLERLAADQQAELLVVSELEAIPPQGACDVAFAPRPDLPFTASDLVMVPFGGRREEWAALELGAWLARAHDLTLRLLGVESKGPRRDATRLLAGASLALQRFAATTAEPVIVPPGADGILAQAGSLVVASLPPDGLDATRQSLIERTAVPLLFVRPGLRPSGLAPDQTLTQFSWSLRDAVKTGEEGEE
jgi:DNA-binding SARP family transcriptional activator